MNQPASNDVVWIRSTVHRHTGTPACLLSWGPGKEAILTIDQTLTTARDLMAAAAAAAAAESDIALIEHLRQDLKADNTVLGGMLLAVRGRRPAPAGAAALRIEAVAGAKTGKPIVRIGRGSLRADLTPDTARTMAQHWIETATAAQIDARLRYVLDEYPQLTPDDVDQIFGKLQDLQR
ncbi:hypothetical protein [Streptomyces sp. NPDC048386]|uniref:hypothetical protein n=1 Tax=Streptomyces sp. NPDC048386 TaxID=3365541 RepID=UPI003718B403